MERILHYFQEICRIPHGSGNCGAIAAYCTAFAEKRGLWYRRDEADNVVIKNPGEGKGKNAPPVILQAHLDMVCQKEPGARDPETDGVELVWEKDFLHAAGTTLGADDGIGVAMILAILEKNGWDHPPLEAVLTSDEEIGMLGSARIDASVLTGRRMINLDGEEGDAVIVSCAGGSDARLELPLDRTDARGTLVTVTLSGLHGGHSGVEIDCGRENAIVLAGRILCHLQNKAEFSLVSVSGGGKINAIPHSAAFSVLTPEKSALITALEEFLPRLAATLALREPQFAWQIEAREGAKAAILSDSLTKTVADLLCLVPNGVVSRGSEGVTTSLNAGVLRSSDAALTLDLSLRSNDPLSLSLLEEAVLSFGARMGCQVLFSGAYPPWPRKADSALLGLYSALYEKKTGAPACVYAIHAGLECGVFAGLLPGLDCISVGPDLSGVHTPREKLSLSSLKQTYAILNETLSALTE